MARKSAAQPTLTEVRLKTAPCVPAIREAVKGWVAGGYAGATDTCRLLLNHWFHQSHRIGGRAFQYHWAQREAVETAVYLFEVAKVRRAKTLLMKYSAQSDL